MEELQEKFLDFANCYEVKKFVKEHAIPPAVLAESYFEQFADTTCFSGKFYISSEIEFILDQAKLTHEIHLSYFMKDDWFLKKLYNYECNNTYYDPFYDFTLTLENLWNKLVVDVWRHIGKEFKYEKFFEIYKKFRIRHSDFFLYGIHSEDKLNMFVRYVLHKFGISSTDAFKGFVFKFDELVDYSCNDLGEFNKLPMEIVDHILCFCNYKDVNIFQRVSKSFLTFSNRDELWQKKICFEGIDLDVDVDTLSKKMKYVYLTERIKSFKNIKSLRCD